jgi:hypothetical protein
VPAGSKPEAFGVVPGAGAYEVEEVLPNARVVLKQRAGGAFEAKSPRVVFQYVQDDAAAAALFKAGTLDVLEIATPMLQRQIVGADGKLTVPGRLVEADIQQIRLLIFNRAAIAKALSVPESDVQEWIKGLPAAITSDLFQKRFGSFAIPIGTSYFPARKVYAREPLSGAPRKLSGKLLVVTDNDVFSDAIASVLPRELNGVTIDHVGLEKSVSLSRFLKQDYEINLTGLEAVSSHNGYWQSFFTPGSPFARFGEPLDGLKAVDTGNEEALRHNAKLIDEKGNWLILFQQKHFYAFQPGISGERFLATGHLTYARIGREP